MKKLVVLLCLILVAAMVMPVSALKFKDMSDNHWAAKSVYDLVNRGITQGFPDGTFRGDEKLTRYETAMFLSKMADSIEDNFSKLGGAVGSDAADIAGVKADVRALKAEVANLRRAKAAAPAGTPGGLAISGSFMVDAKLADILPPASQAIANRCEVYDYRLQLAGTKDLGGGNTLKVGLDTMDYGWYGSTTPDFATNLIDAAMNLKMDWSAVGFDSPMAVKLSTGPGPRAVANASVPADNGVIMDREYNEVAASSSILGMGIKLAGIAKTIGNTGSVGNKVGQLGLGFNLGNLIPGIGGLKLGLGGEYVHISSSNHETHLSLDLAGTVGIPTIGLGIKLANSDAAGGSSNDKLLLAANLGLNDVWNSGTVIGLQVARVGSLYAVNAANLIDATGRDVFNRALANDVMDIGGTLTQGLSDTLKLKLLGDYRTSANGTYSGQAQAGYTLEGGIDYEIAPSASLNVAYRYLQTATGTRNTADFLRAGLTYTF